MPSGKIDHFASINTTSKGYFIWTQWNSEENGEFNGFVLTLFSGLQSWRGAVSKERLSEMAEGVQDYMDLTKQALATDLTLGTTNKFLYDIKFDDHGAKLTWKKSVSDKIRFELGTIELGIVEETAVVFDSLLQHCSDRFGSMSKRIRALEDENLQLADERKRALERLAEATEAKLTCEENLMESFSQLFNAKKRKIAELMEEIEHLQERLKSDQVEATAKETQEASVAPKPKAKPQEKSKRVEDDRDEDTDEEKEHFEEARRKRKRAANLDNIPLIMTDDGNDQTTSNQSSSITANGKEDDELFVPKRRKRNKQSTQVEQASPSRMETRSRQSTKVSPESIDLNSQRQTRGSIGSSMNLISKLT